MKRIYIPAPRPINPFFDAIEKGAHTEFTFGSLNELDPAAHGVLFQWPEQLFDWKEPTEENVSVLKNFLAEVKHKGLPVFYLVHNLRPHRGMTPGFQVLYHEVLSAADVMIHMGEFSARLLAKEFLQCDHVVIPHPLYDSFEPLDKLVCRKKLDIPADSQVIFCPGEVRDVEERDWLIKAFNALKVKDKVLIVPRMFRYKSKVEFRGRIRLNRFIDVRALHEKWLNRISCLGRIIQLDNKFKGKEVYSEMLFASDIVFVARKELLNSGGLFLGLSVQKVVVAPRVGNMAETLEEFSFPTFDPPVESSVTEALAKGLDTPFPKDHPSLLKYEGKAVGKKYDELFESYGSMK